jgi:uncharacterized membrane protein
MVANLVASVGLYIPVLKQVKHSFRSKVKHHQKRKEMNLASVTRSSNSTNSTETKLVNKQSKESPTIKENNIQHSVDNSEENIGNASKSRRESLQRRVTIMFLVIIIAYVLSYIPPLVLLILAYALEDFNFITLSEGETIAWTYLPRFFILNNIVNPFIYGYFDTKFRDQLQRCFKKWKSCLVCYSKG